MLLLVPTKVDLIIKKQNCKQGIVGASSASNIKIVRTLLDGLYVWDN